MPSHTTSVEQSSAITITPTIADCQASDKQINFIRRLISDLLKKDWEGVNRIKPAVINLVGKFYSYEDVFNYVCKSEILRFEQLNKKQASAGINKLLNEIEEVTSKVNQNQVQYA